VKKEAKSYNLSIALGLPLTADRFILCPPFFRRKNLRQADGG